MRHALAILFSAALAFAGKSLQLSTQTASSAVPKVLGGVSFRVQFSIHDWDTTSRTGVPIRWTSGNLFVMTVASTGTNAISFQVYTDTDNAAVCNAALTGLPSQFVTVRWQHAISTGTSGTDYCQAWDSAGTMVLNTSSQFTTNSTVAFNDGVTLAGLSGSTAVDFAYFQIYGDVVPVTARPPVTADTTTNCLVYLKFDLGNNTGSLNDACSTGPYNAVLSSGSATYIATPFQTLVISTIKLASPPLWGNVASVRAGFPAQLDGTASYSQADASATTTYLWSLLSGPSAVTLDSTTSGTPTTQSPYTIFGDYYYQLVATDVALNSATSSQHIGSVSTDTNGIVSTGSSLVDFIFGPLIAWGRNPWGYQDYWHARASGLRAADYLLPVSDQGQSYPGWSTLGKPQWEFYGAGTVSYPWNCSGGIYFCPGSAGGTTLNGSITSTATTITVTDASKLNLTSFPTRVIVYDGTNQDELRVASAAGNVLTLSYDPAVTVRHAFANGVTVLQSKVTGTSTLFLTDATTAVCPVGVGPPGVSVYSTGTITLTANSTTVTGSGTTFPTTAAGDWLRVSGATHSGTPFTFVAKITTRDSTTQLTLARVFPADADTAGGLTYKVMPLTRTLVMEYPSLWTDPTYAPSAKAQQMWGVSWCESETALYLNPIPPGGLVNNGYAYQHDIPALDGAVQTGQRYSITDTTGWVNQAPTGGINFYGEDLAHRALYFRSGLTSAYDAAAIMSNYWIRSPWGNADGNGTPRLWIGGGGIGAFASKLTDSSSLVSWADLRGYADMGRQMVAGVAANGCNAWTDTRDMAYAYSWLILAAIYDPDTVSTSAPGGISWSAYWRSFLPQMQTNDAACERTDHSFANGFYFNTTQNPALTLTNGSTAVTGTGISSSMCNGIGSGTATVTNGSNALTVITGSIPTGTVLYLTGTTGGGATVFFQALAYSGTGSSATLGGNWLGDSGTISWTASALNIPTGEGAGSMPGQVMTIATDNNDLTNLQKNWACTWNNSSSVTLNRPWDGTSGTYHAYVTNLAGYGQQPYMPGIKTQGHNWMATQTVPALSAYIAPYQTLASNVAGWIWNTGMDPQLLGTNFGRIFQQCEPTNVAPVGTSLGIRSAGCTYGNDTSAVVLSREQNAEASAAHNIFYQYNFNPTNLTQGDKWYGALWCSTPYTTGGVYCDSLSTANNQGASNLTDVYVHQGKWFGFFAGIGMSSRWPAVRLSGAQISTTPVGITNGKAVLRGIAR